MKKKKKVIITDSEKKQILKKIRRQEAVELSKKVNLKTQVVKNKKKYNRKNNLNSTLLED